jgi:HSP20 family protein
MAVTKVSSTIHFTTRSSALGYSTDAGLVVKVELAGMKSDSLEIVVDGSRLRISGTRPDCCRAPHCSFLVMEITYGPFETVLDLPPGYDLNAAKAIYVNGFLRIDVPPAKPVPAKSKRVPINEGE